eukprot:992202-Ditylum_brightwellii.AAC.1
MMNTFTKSKSVSRDEASYMLGGGLFKRMSIPVRKCSNVNIPRRICLEILRRKLRFVTDHSKDILCKTDLAHSPTKKGGRRNEEHKLCFDLNDTKVEGSDPDINGDLIEQHFEELNGGDDEVNWSEGYDEKYESWLERMSTAYYENQTGKPVTGKSFVILTLRNIAREILKPTMCDVAGAPTGCAATLISESLVVVMDEVVRQQDPEFLYVLDAMKMEQ